MRFCILGWRSREEHHSFMVCGCTRSQGHRTAPVCCNSGHGFLSQGLSFCICQSQGSWVAMQTKQDGGRTEAEEHLVLAGGCQSPSMLIDWRQHRLISSRLSWVLSAIQSPLHRSPSFFLPPPQLFSGLCSQGPALSCVQGQLSLVFLLLGLTPPLFSLISLLRPIHSNA